MIHAKRNKKPRVVVLTKRVIIYPSFTYGIDDKSGTVMVLVFPDNNTSAYCVPLDDILK